MTFSEKEKRNGSESKKDGGNIDKDIRIKTSVSSCHRMNLRQSPAGKMTPRFLSTVDELLRRQGYALIDLHTEKGLIGVVSIEQVVQWGILKMQDEVPQEDEEQEDDKVFNT